MKHRTVSQHVLEHHQVHEKWMRPFPRAAWPAGPSVGSSPSKRHGTRAGKEKRKRIISSLEKEDENILHAISGSWVVTLVCCINHHLLLLVIRCLLRLLLRFHPSQLGHPRRFLPFPPDLLSLARAAIRTQLQCHLPFNLIQKKKTQSHLMSWQMSSSMKQLTSIIRRCFAADLLVVKHQDKNQRYLIHVHRIYMRLLRFWFINWTKSSH